MFVLNKDDLSIYVTRGDMAFFSVSADDKGTPYTFKPGDVVRIKVFAKKNADNVVLQKDFTVIADTTEVEIFLDKTDTKIGKVISKPTDYWYEVELNPLSNPQTIIGYDEDGPKVFKLYPEGADIEGGETITEDDIPFVDSALNTTSKRPIENQAVARAIVQLDAADAELEKQITKKTGELSGTIIGINNALAVERDRIDTLVAGTTPEGAEVVDIRNGANGTVYSSAGTAVREQLKHKMDNSLYSLNDKLREVDANGIVNFDTFNFTAYENAGGYGYISFEASFTEPVTELTVDFDFIKNTDKISAVQVYSDVGNGTRVVPLNKETHISDTLKNKNYTNNVVLIKIQVYGGELPFDFTIANVVVKSVGELTKRTDLKVFTGTGTVVNGTKEVYGYVTNKELYKSEFDVEFTAGGATDEYGSIGWKDENRFKYTNLVGVTGGKTLRLVNVVCTATVVVQMFDEQRHFVGAYKPDGVSSYTATFDIPVPANVNYIRFTKWDDNICTVKYANGDYRETKLDIFPSLFYHGKNAEAEKPIITFIDDDGRKEFLTILKPILDKYGYKATTAVVPEIVNANNSSYMTIAQLKTLVDEGFDVCSHTYSHGEELYQPGVADEATDEQIYNDMVKGREWMRKNSFNADGLVYPWGGYADPARYARLAIRAGYQYACNTSGGVMNSDIINTFWLSRSFATDANGFGATKNMIDNCINGDGWLIIGTHIYNGNELSVDLFEQIVKYVSESGALVKTYAEAFDIKRNICSIGYYGDKSGRLYIGRSGRILNN